MTTVPHVIIDDFLPDRVHHGLVQHVLTVADFTQGKVRIDGRDDHAPELRRGLHSDDRLGAFLAPFRKAVTDRFDDLRDGLKMPQFDRSGFEILLVAHNDGDFYAPHRDVFTGKERLLTPGDRMITLVYYLHRAPRAFTGGELRIFPFGDSPPLLVEPRDNRLIAFPSFLLHEVRPIAVPDRDFANSRFSVSCWLNRARPAAPADAERSLTVG